MCNIAGYTGSKRAAPILIDMIKKQEYLDGGLSTGIATIDNGILYYAKVTGNSDELIKKTDALSFPGTCGIIHSRPDDNYLEYAHPFISKSGKTALCSNGNLCADETLTMIRNSVAEFLNRNGIIFESARELKKSSYPQLNDGRYVAYGEVFLKTIAYVIQKSNVTYEQAMAETSCKLFSDVVNVLVSANSPDNIYVTRISRPMNIMVCENESYISTSQFGFPHVSDMKYMKSLPQMTSCIVNKTGFEETPYPITGGKVTDYSAEEYDAIKAKLKEKLKKEHTSMDSIGGGILTVDRSADNLRPHVKAIYDALWDIYNEGILKTEVKNSSLPWLPGKKVKRTFFYI